MSYSARLIEYEMQQMLAFSKLPRHFLFDLTPEFESPELRKCIFDCTQAEKFLSVVFLFQDINSDEILILHCWWRNW